MRKEPPAHAFPMDDLFVLTLTGAFFSSLCLTCNSPAEDAVSHTEHCLARPLAGLSGYWVLPPSSAGKADLLPSGTALSDATQVELVFHDENMCCSCWQI